MHSSQMTLGTTCYKHIFHALTNISLPSVQSTHHKENNELLATRGSAHAETVQHASHWMHATKIQNSTIFYNPLVFLSTIRDHSTLSSELTSARR